MKTKPMSTPTSMSKGTITCLSVDCPERFSLCCHAGSERGKGGFVCKACKEPFVGGKCNGYDLLEATPPAKEEDILTENEFRRMTMGCFYQDELRKHNNSLRSQAYKEGRREAIEEALRLRRFEDTDNGGMALDLSRKSPWINAEDIDALKDK